ncbi:hypothetical protein NDU88_003578, partial [Pleurodeles waltl]
MYILVCPSMFYYCMDGRVRLRVSWRLHLGTAASLIIIYPVGLQPSYYQSNHSS